MNSRPNPIAAFLRESRPTRPQMPSADFASRVMAEVVRTPRLSSADSAFHPSWWLTATAAAAMLVLAGGLLRKPAPSNALALAEVREVLTWTPSATLADFDPAARELESLRRDGEKALDFVKQQTDWIVATW